MTRSVDAGGLTPAQATFAAGLAAGKSQSAAYREAYPRSRNWADATVWSKASLLAAHGKVQARVSAKLARAVGRAELDVSEVLRELKCLCLSDIGCVLQADGRVKLPRELDANTRRAIASFEIDDLGRVKYRFWDKNAALEKAIRYLGMFETDNLQKPALIGRVELVPMTKRPMTAVSEMQAEEGREA